jgi:hypothetical protein
MLFSCASSAPQAKSEIRQAVSVVAPQTQARPTPSWSPLERQTVELSFIALAGCWNTDPAKVCEAVTDLLGEMLPRQEIVWGPAVHQPRPGFLDSESKLTDALVYICRDRDTGEYSVVFRGTNTVSATEWLLQDFMVQNQVPWLKVQAGAAPADALVSEGTATAVALRRDLRPEKGEKGEGTSLEDALIGILESSSPRCVMRFTGHSLGGLLAPVMALWLVDRLAETHRDDLTAKLDLEVYGYAAPTAGNRAFSAYLESRIHPIRRYASSLDIAPMAWDESSMERMPSTYEPGIRMQSLTHSLYDLCRNLARGKGYAQPGPCISVPSKIVPTRGDLFLLEAAYQHAAPYLGMLSPDRSQMIVHKVLDPLAESISVMGFKPVEIEKLYSLEP